MATTPDEQTGRARRIKEVVEEGVGRAAKEVISTRFITAGAVVLAVGLDRPGTAIAVGALLYAAGRK